MYLDSIALVRTTPCLAEPGKIIVTGQPARSLADVIPYLATLPDVIAYNPETLSLTFRRRTGFLTLYPDRVYITKVTNTEEGVELLTALTGAINATWEHRQDLVAASTSRRAPRPLDIYAQLPQTNCRKCGWLPCSKNLMLLTQLKKVGFTQLVGLWGVLAGVARQSTPLSS